jgi:hypothetical protein
MIDKLVGYITARAMEPSSWRGILIGTPAALMLYHQGWQAIVADPTAVDKLIPLGMLGSGLVGALVPDKWKPKE